jgi:hypothetical protein
MKTFMKKILIALTFIGSMFAADVPKGPPATKLVSAEIKAKFWKANAIYISQSTKLQQAEAEVKQAQAEAQSFCGDKYNLDLDSQGDLTCVEKPAEKPAEKTEKK